MLSCDQQCHTEQNRNVLSVRPLLPLCIRLSFYPSLKTKNGPGGCAVMHSLADAHAAAVEQIVLCLHTEKCGACGEASELRASGYIKARET